MEDNILLPPLIESFIKQMADVKAKRHHRDNAMDSLIKYRDSIDRSIEEYKKMRDLENFAYRNKSKNK